MHPSTALAWSWLNVLTKKRYDALIAKFGDLDAALNAVDMELLMKLGCKEDTAMKAINRLDEFNVESYGAELEKRDIYFLSIEDEVYPAALRNIADPPVFLYYKGSLQILSEPCIGCVGTRAMSSYGKRVVELFVPAFVNAGMVTVSGLAEGIDAEVAKESIVAKGKTAAVLGHGLGLIYPKANAKLAEQIVANRGVLLSEFPLDCQPDKFTFPARNRIIAGLSLGTVVFEAGEGSGAIITADLALEYGRECFAVPGQIFDENFVGCHALIASGRAALVTNPDQVLAEIGIVASLGNAPSRPYLTDDPVEAAIFNVLSTMPQSVDDLVGKADLQAAIVGAKLTMLEIRGVARNIGGGMWVKA